MPAEYQGKHPYLAIRREESKGRNVARGRRLGEATDASRKERFRRHVRSTQLLGVRLRCPENGLAELEGATQGRGWVRCALWY